MKCLFIFLSCNCVASAASCAMHSLEAAKIVQLQPSGFCGVQVKEATEVFSVCYEKRTFFSQYCGSLPAPQ